MTLKLRLPFLLLVLSIALGSQTAWGQTTIFSENMGTPSGTTAIASNVFENSGTLTYAGTADVRSTGASSGYDGASGGGNVFITNTVGRFFEISGIDTSDYTDLVLTLGHFKSTVAANNELSIEVSSDGVNYTELSYSRPTGTGTNNWILITPSGFIPSAENLRIRFTQTSTGPQFRIDDVKLEGTLGGAPSPVLLSSTPAVNDLNYVDNNGPSAMVTFNVSGLNLDPVDGNVTLTAPANFEISDDNLNFTNTIDVPYTGGELSATPIAVRLQAGLTVDAYNGAIQISGGDAPMVEVAVSGSVIAGFELPYANDFRTQDNLDLAAAQGFDVSEVEYGGTAGGGYTRMPLNSSITSPVINFSTLDAVLVSFSTTTFGGNTGQVLSVLVSNDNGDTYTELGAFPVPAAYATSTQFIDLSSLNGTQGRIKFQMTAGTNQIRFRDLAITIPTPTTWNGAEWSNGTPDINTAAIIEGDLTLSSDLAAATLTVNSGTLTVAAGNTLTVAGAIVNNANAANFVVANDANLIQTSDVANTGDITVNRNSQALLRLDYTLWASPVAGQNLKAFSPETLTNRFYVYDEAATEGNTTDNVGTYVSIINETNEASYNFEAAHGYLIRTPNTFSEDVPAVFNGTFVGTPHNGDFTVALSNANQGFNLVGNPYPSSIALDALFAANANIESSVYFWRKTNGAAGTGYITANNLGYTYPDNSEVADANINIRPGQGFFVKATAATNLVFNNDMRTANSSSIFFRSNDERHRFWLSLMAEDAVLANTLVGYASGATQGIDAGFDSKPFGADYLTSLIGDEAYAIQGRGWPFDTTDTVALQMIAPTAGTYSIALSQFDGLFAAGQKIYLQDALEGTTFDLTSGTYTFNTTEGIVNDRFTIVYENQPLSVSDLNHAAVVVYHNQGQLTVASSQVALQAVSVFDIQGRLLFQSNNINANSIEVPKTQTQGQVLLVRITTVDGITSTRKTIY